MILLTYYHLPLTLQNPNSELRYEIDPDDHVANNYFIINPTQGEISVAQPLVNDPDKRILYNVSMLFFHQSHHIEWIFLHIMTFKISNALLYMVTSLYLFII